jgi:hypothetical protein
METFVAHWIDPRYEESSLCLNLIAIGLMLWLESEVLVGRAKEHFAVNLLAHISFQSAWDVLT